MTKTKVADVRARFASLTEDVLDVEQAAEVIGCGQRLIRKAIRDKKLVARMPRGITDPTRAGAGTKYMIHVKDLQEWYFPDFGRG